MDSLEEVELLALMNANAGQFEIVIKVLDTSLWLLFDQVFIRTRSYELGLDFVAICTDQVEKHKDEIEPWKYEDYQQRLIRLELKMLDYLNRIEEYLSYSDWVIENVQIFHQGDPQYKTSPRYLLGYAQESGNLIVERLVAAGERKVHFLCTESHRYDIISRKLEKRNAGKNIEHLKRHQQDRLTEEEIARRYELLISFFTHYHSQD